MVDKKYNFYMFYKVINFIKSPFKSNFFLIKSTNQFKFLFYFHSFNFFLIIKNKVFYKLKYLIKVQKNQIFFKKFFKNYRISTNLISYF